MTDVGLTVLRVSKSVFESSLNITNLFLMPLAILRVFLANVSGNRESDYFSILRGVVFYFILSFGFPMVLEILFSIPDHFAPSVSSVAKSVDAMKSSGAGLMPLGLRWGLESLISCLYFVAVYLNFAVTVLMSAIAPVVFLLCTVFSIGLGVRAFFGLLIMVSSWPIVFYAASQLQSLSEPVTGGDALGLIVFELVTALIKVLGPMSVAYLGLHSGPGQVVLKTVRGAPGGVRLMGAVGGQVREGVSRVSRVTARQYGTLERVLNRGVAGLSDSSSRALKPLRGESSALDVRSQGSQDSRNIKHEIRNPRGTNNKGEGE